MSRRTSGNAAVWALTGLIASVSVALWYFHVRYLGALSPELDIPWLLLVIGFAIAESFVIHLHFRASSGTFSLLEIPMVIALLFTPAGPAWAAMVLGSFITLVVVRRQPLIKWTFNVANLSLHYAIAATISHALISGDQALAPAGWVAIAVATIGSELLESLAIAAVISLSERRVRWLDFSNMIVFGTLVSAANTVQAIIAALVVTSHLLGVALLAVSMTIILTAYRAYMSERDNRERVEFLYNSTKALRETQKTDKAVETLLTESASMFRATVAELHLFASPDTGDSYTVYRLGADGLEFDVRDADNEAEVLELAAKAVRPQLVIDHTAPEELRQHIDQLGMRDALFGTLRTENRFVGLLVMYERLGNVLLFSPEDLRLFDNLVQQTSLAFENDQLEQALVQLRALEAELAHQARFDSLTGLANRSLFTQRLHAELARPDHDELSVLYLDLDNFKPVNDTLGHAAGDDLLIQVAERITAVVREDDVTARLGGDEFAVLLTKEADIARLANRLVEAISQPFRLDSYEVVIGASIGVAYARDASSDTQLLQNADLAMYRAKELGKGSVVFYSDELRVAVNRNEEIQISLQRAVADEEFELRYQPIVRLSDQVVVGAEALVRWRDDGGQLRTPAEFITEAEQSGLMASIDRQVRAMVLRDLREISETAPDEFFASVNISLKHLRETDFAADLRRDLLVAGVNPASFVIEATEGVILDGAETATKTLIDMGRLGVGLAIDDFGTGYSALMQLRDLPVRMVKIPESILTDQDQPKRRAFIEGVVTLAGNIECEVVAKGVESAEAVDVIRDVGCDHGQGFHLGSPMTINDLADLLAGHRPATTV